MYLAYIILKKFDFNQKTPGVGTIFFMAVTGLNCGALCAVSMKKKHNNTGISRAKRVRGVAVRKSLMLSDQSPVMSRHAGRSLVNGVIGASHGCGEAEFTGKVLRSCVMSLECCGQRASETVENHRPYKSSYGSFSDCDVSCVSRRAHAKYLRVAS